MPLVWNLLSVLLGTLGPDSMFSRIILDVPLLLLFVSLTHPLGKAT